MIVHPSMANTRNSDKVILYKVQRNRIEIIISFLCSVLFYRITLSSGSYRYFMFLTAYGLWLTSGFVQNHKYVYIHDSFFCYTVRIITFQNNCWLSHTSCVLKFNFLSLLAAIVFSFCNHCTNHDYPACRCILIMIFWQ